mmetsp:Transcript_56452/g.99744  ORF Transcript_56452/g.99744 Transcript_56452/m.99744 type:complete len:112 (-) Transcript_56452:951-1286(-)
MKPRRPRTTVHTTPFIPITSQILKYLINLNNTKEGMLGAVAKFVWRCLHCLPLCNDVMFVVYPREGCKLGSVAGRAAHLVIWHICRKSSHTQYLQYRLGCTCLEHLSRRQV